MAQVTKTVGTFKKIPGLTVEITAVRKGGPNEPAAVGINITMPFGVNIKKTVNPADAGAFAALLVVAQSEAEKP